MKSSKPAITRKSVPGFRGAKAQPAVPAKVAEKSARPRRGDNRILEAEVDGRRERVVLEAQKELVLRCGKASLTLTADGKIILKGANVLSTSSGPQRIRGASVSIN